MNKKYAFALILSLWLVLLIGFISVKEFTVRTGEKGLLKTQPVDPRDLFRGDYIILRYEISTASLSELGVNEKFSIGDVAYALLEKQGEYFTLKNISGTAPTTLHLKGRVSSVSGTRLTLEYGIESYFVPEGDGQHLEAATRQGTLGVEISVDRFGKAAITGLFLDEEKVEFKT